MQGTLEPPDWLFSVHYSRAPDFQPLALMEFIEVKNIQQAQPLSQLLDNLSSISWKDWIFIGKNISQLSLDTVCYTANIDDHSDEEIEKYTSDNDIRLFFYRGQIDGIIDNLKAQKKSIDNNDKLKAINFYFSNDAFIDLS